VDAVERVVLVNIAGGPCELRALHHALPVLREGGKR
jgi:hypothetical protein